jgi:hypothetical protein
LVVGFARVVHDVKSVLYINAGGMFASRWYSRCARDSVGVIRDDHLLLREEAIIWTIEEGVESFLAAVVRTTEGVEAVQTVGQVVTLRISAVIGHLRLAELSDFIEEFISTCSCEVNSIFTSVIITTEIIHTV